MLFNSLDFALFLPAVFGLYWFILNRNLKGQNLLLLVASYIFYGWWDYRFLSLIFISTVIDYLVGLQLAKTPATRSRTYLLWISLIANLGMLGFFKYFDFFLLNFVEAFTLLGMQIEAAPLRFILPVGISFYTFQTLSYTLDIYKGKLQPTRDFIAFAGYVSFFPQLVAGPIERAAQLLPQFEHTRVFDYAQATDGLKQILWGLFKKVVIADNCATFADLFFDPQTPYGGSALLLGAFFFTFQIYGDFSGYSDIAIGTARLFGFDLMQNFAFPYFSRDVAEFWRRWHISLSTWFRDYLYIPLGGSRGGRMKQIRNTFAIFLVSGFWHGANWTFLIWGGLHALYFLPLLLLQRNRKHLHTVAKGKVFPSFSELGQIFLTFLWVMFAWIFFRAESLHHALTFIRHIFTPALFSVPVIPGQMGALAMSLSLIVLFILIEWRGRMWLYAIQHLGKNRPQLYRWGIYILLIFMIGMYMKSSETPFIYFQF
ncbi:MAG: MBOAT family O-acyltransferase [Bacteroidota bacterium]